MQQFPIEIWFVWQLLVDLLWVISFVYVLRQLRTRKQPSSKRSEKTADAVMGMLEPLLREAEKTAKAFEIQIREKDRLIKRLNEKLDTRIVSMNLLINRMDAYVSSSCEPMPSLPGAVRGILPGHDDINDQCSRILEYDRRGDSVETIAQRLSIPAGEVKLVLDLKKKFTELEQKT